jgi:hypothetical protein
MNNIQTIDYQLLIYFLNYKKCNILIIRPFINIHMVFISNERERVAPLLTQNHYFANKLLMLQNFTK